MEVYSLYYEQFPFDVDFYVSYWRRSGASLFIMVTCLFIRCRNDIIQVIMAASRFTLAIIIILGSPYQTATQTAVTAHLRNDQLLLLTFSMQSRQ